MILINYCASVYETRDGEDDAHHAPRESPEISINDGTPLDLTHTLLPWPNCQHTLGHPRQTERHASGESIGEPIRKPHSRSHPSDRKYMFFIRSRTYGEPTTIYKFRWRDPNTNWMRTQRRALRSINNAPNPRVKSIYSRSAGDPACWSCDELVTVTQSPTWLEE